MIAWLLQYFFLLLCIFWLHVSQHQCKFLVCEKLLGSNPVSDSSSDEAHSNTVSLYLSLQIMLISSGHINTRRFVSFKQLSVEIILHWACQRERKRKKQEQNIGKFSGFLVWHLCKCNWDLMLLIKWKLICSMWCLSGICLKCFKNAFYMPSLNWEGRALGLVLKISGCMKRNFKAKI